MRSFILQKDNTHININIESFHDNVIYLIHITTKDFSWQDISYLQLIF